MNKKLARKIKHRRDKERNKNFALAAQETLRRKTLRDFTVGFISDERVIHIGANHPACTCYHCGKKIFRKNLKAQEFVGFQVKGHPGEYLVHRDHLFENGDGTQRADAPEVLSQIWEKLAKEKLGDLMKEKD